MGCFTFNWHIVLPGVMPMQFLVVETIFKGWFDNLEIGRQIKIARCEERMVLDVQNFAA